MRRDKFAYAGQTVQTKDGKTFEVEDYVENVLDTPWMFANGNPAALMYAVRVGTNLLPIDNEAVYGHIDGLGCIYHVSELILPVPNYDVVLPNGYTMTTTFIQDFKIADKYGVAAVKETYDRAFSVWKDKYVYLTELVIALNFGLWRADYNNQEDLSEVYSDLYYRALSYAYNHLEGEELEFFSRVID